MAMQAGRARTGAAVKADGYGLGATMVAKTLFAAGCRDFFVAWAPNKHVSLTLAHVDLGHIVPAVVPKRQTGTYLSAQLAF